MKKLLLLIFFAVFSVNAQNSLWRKIDNVESTAIKLPRDSNPREFLLYSLDVDALKNQLQNAPNRNFTQNSDVIIQFPNSDGKMQSYTIFEAPVMESEISAAHPDMKSYVGKGIDDKTATMRFSVTLFGLHTMTLSGNGADYIDPYTKDLKNYIVYNKSQMVRSRIHTCSFDDVNPQDRINELDNIDENLLNNFRADNSLFKTYRLAMACTIEYAAYHVNAAGLNSGTLAQKKAAVLAAMNVTVTRVNSVYERDFSITLVIINGNEAIINITSDTLDNNNTNNALLFQIQAYIDSLIPTSDYDIGHVVSTGGGGVASLQSPCSSIKAQGVTGLPSPVGDDYDIDFVAHEMGHQFGCNHTFNGSTGNCAGNATTTSAFEPGSGTTIMAYAGICAPQDVQPHSDAYFHARSILQAGNFINGNGNCAVAVPNGNTPPTVEAGQNYTIPYGTAFVLDGVASDADNDALTYCWEQYNFNAGFTGPASPTNTAGANFRSFNPTVSSKRYFPVLTSVIANNLIPTWEVVPSVARTMTFSLVVRDNRSPNGGQTGRDTMTLTLANTGPFKVTSQSTTTGWPQNSSQTITWDVAGTDANGINTAFVNIKLSTDGGLTYPITLAANTPNDGSEVITVPNLVTQTARVMVEAVDNVYYALNAKNINIGYEVVNLCTTYGSSIAPFNLTDGTNTYTVKTINVPTAGTITDANLTINATHPNLQNLVIAAIRPGGTLSTLYNQQCAGSANMNITFDAQGAAFACGSPTSGTYVPPTGFNLNSWNGFSQQGNWQIGIKDVVAGNAGMINSIALEVCTETVQLLTNESFTFEDFILYPNPNKGNFTIQFNSKSDSKINISVYDMRGRSIFEKKYVNSGLFNQNLQLENVQSGIYLVSVSDGSNKITKRIIIE
jgi:subtilisin-like proprotein convertase family protein